MTTLSRDTEKGGLEAWPILLAEAHTVLLLERKALGTSLAVAVPKQDF
jgi:hypothetical protein